MPTLVLDLDASDPLHDLHVPPPFDAVHALLRWRGVPVGAAWLAAPNGVVTARRIHDELVRPAQRRIDARRVQEWLSADAPLPDDSLARVPSVTIAICTRDRPDDLARCLAAAGALPDDGQQVLVIDNAPASDASRRVVERHPRVRYVREPRPGLSRAHNRALREAETEIVAFIDDDAIPDPGWLRALRHEFADPRTMCVTGPAAPLELETPAQEWFERTNAFSRGFDRTVHDGATGDPFFVARVGAGVNMALRRSVLTQVGPFDEALDSGTPTLGGGDHDMFTRILAEGYRIVYQPAALVRHRHRRTWDELRNTFRAYGTGAYAYLTRHALRGEWRAPFVALAWLPSQLGRLARALGSGAHRPYLSLGWSELLGCAAGPFAYVRSRRRAPAPVPEPAPLPDEPARQTVAHVESGEDLPRISVIIPTHDRRAHIERILTRLACAAYPPDRFEVIVVADGCTDGTTDVVRRTTPPFALRVEDLSPGRGAAAARNRGAALATGAILLFLDDDMDPPVWFLSEHAALHDEGVDRVVVGAPIPVRPGPGAAQYDIAMWSWWEAKLEQMSSPGHRFRHEEIFTGVLSMPASMFSRLDGFDETFACREDYELGARLIGAGVPIVYARQAGAPHLELRSPRRLYERKRAEGRADVALARKHPVLWPALRLSERAPGWWTAMGIVRRLASVPSLANAVAAMLARALPMLERLHARRTWRTAHSALAYLWYWRGVRDVMDEAGLRTLAAQCASAAVPAREIDVDLAAGLRTAERRLDQARPDAVRVRYGDAMLGTIGAVSGGEPLRGMHLRAALARDVGESLARALDSAQAHERPRLAATHLTRHA